jgi:tetratricopeptide (TPR) repeat protein
LVAARKELEKAYAITKSPLLSAKIANMALASGDLEAAEKASRKAIEGIPDLPGPNLTLAEVLIRQDKAQEAGDVIDAAVDINPFDPRVHSLKLAVLGPEGDKEETSNAQLALAILNQDNRIRKPDLGVGGLISIQAEPFSRVFIVREEEHGPQTYATGLVTPTSSLVIRPGTVKIKLVPPTGTASFHEVQITATPESGKIQKIDLNEQGS